MLRAIRVELKIDTLKIEDEKASGGAMPTVLVYEKDFGRTIESIIEEALAVVEKNG